MELDLGLFCIRAFVLPFIALYHEAQLSQEKGKLSEVSRKLLFRSFLFVNYWQTKIVLIVYICQLW